MAAQPQAIPMPAAIRCNLCTGDAARREFRSQKSLGVHKRFVHSMTQAQRRAASRKRLATMKRNKAAASIEAAIPEAPAPAKRGRPRKATANGDRPGPGSKPTYEDVLSFLRTRRTFIDELLHDLEGMRHG